MRGRDDAPAGSARAGGAAPTGARRHRSPIHFGRRAVSSFFVVVLAVATPHGGTQPPVAPRLQERVHRVGQAQFMAWRCAQGQRRTYTSPGWNPHARSTAA